MDKMAPNTTLALMQNSQANAAQASSKLKNAHNIKGMERITKTAEEFEAVFIAEMMKPMFEGISHDGMFGGGKGEEVFHGMLVQEYGKLMSQTGSIGIADEIKSAMIQMQAEAQGMDKTDITTPAAGAAETKNLNGLTNGEHDATSNE